MTADNPWQLQAACRDADPELFFHPEGERGPVRRKRDADALAICSVCPVLAACRQDALTSRVAYGVWGGLTEDAREDIYARQRPTQPLPAAQGRPPNRRLPPEVEQMVRILHRRGIIVTKIAKLCLISRDAVRRIIRDAEAAEREQVAS